MRDACSTLCKAAMVSRSGSANLLVAGDAPIRSDSIKLIRGEVTYDVMYGESVITSVDEDDAKAEGTSGELIAKARMTKIIYAIHNFRTVTSFSSILKNVAISIGR